MEFWSIVGKMTQTSHKPTKFKIFNHSDLFANGNSKNYAFFENFNFPVRMFWKDSLLSGEPKIDEKPFYEVK